VRGTTHIVAVGLVALLGACTGAPSLESEVTAAAPDTVWLGAASVAIAGFTIDTARLQPWSATTTAPARITLDPARYQALGSITEGRVSRVLVREGDAVRAGQILVAIHSHEIMDARSGLVRAESAYRTAQAERDAADVALGRAERLLAAKAMGQAEVDRARVSNTAAEAQLAAATAELARATGLLEHLLGDGPLPAGLDPHEVLIRAPFDGVVVQRTAVTGSVVLPGDALLAVADPRALLLEVRLSDRQVGEVAVGSRVHFTLVGDAGDASVGTAVVRRITPVVDGTSRTTMAMAELVAVPPGTRAERFANATIDGVAEQTVVVVPVQAVQALAGDTIVIAAAQRGDGLFLEAVRVRVGRRDDRHAEIVAGLEAGRPIVSRGAVTARAELQKRRDGGSDD
jgi:cobalt-zinc-cadmium efflux system membrane fusion protein